MGKDHRAERASGEPTRPLKQALLLCLGYLLAEVVGGVAAGSLALLADAGHMLSDAASLSVALLAQRLARRPPDGRLTYGWQRAEILGATLNAATLLAVGLLVVVEAARRLAWPQPVRGTLVLAVAIPGLAVNLAMAWILHRGPSHNLNLRAAFLHVLVDTLGSVQVIAAGLLASLFGWFWADGVASLLIALLLVISAWRVLKEATLILMEASPAGVDLAAIGRRLLQEEGVLGVHDLHVWLLTPSFVAASLHLEVSPSAPDHVLWRVRRILAEDFGIHHTTIQVEKTVASEGEPLPRYPGAGPAPSLRR